jgi:hypothetical protein
VLSKYNQELLVQASSILKNLNRNRTNSIEFQILEHSLISNSISVPILKSCNGESCSLFNSLQIHILFEIFLSRESQFLIESNLVQFENSV